MKTIKIKSTGVVSTVSDEYFKTYENSGWFIEVPDTELKPVVKKVIKKKTEE